MIKTAEIPGPLRVGELRAFESIGVHATRGNRNLAPRQRHDGHHSLAIRCRAPKDRMIQQVLGACSHGHNVTWHLLQCGGCRRCDQGSSSRSYL